MTTAVGVGVAADGPGDDRVLGRGDHRRGAGGTSAATWPDPLPPATRPCCELPRKKHRRWWNPHSFRGWRRASLNQGVRPWRTSHHGVPTTRTETRRGARWYTSVGAAPQRLGFPACALTISRAAALGRRQRQWPSQPASVRRASERCVEHRNPSRGRDSGSLVGAAFVTAAEVPGSGDLRL